MANEKSNNVRILQSTQKNNLPPLAHAAIGFLVGAAVIIVVGLGYFYLNSDDQPTNAEMTRMEKIKTMNPIPRSDFINDDKTL